MAALLTLIDPKEHARLAARAALTGGTLVTTTDDRDRAIHVLSLGAMTLHLKTLNEVDAVLARFEHARKDLYA